MEAAGIDPRTISTAVTGRKTGVFVCLRMF